MELLRTWSAGGFMLLLDKERELTRLSKGRNVPSTEDGPVRIVRSGDLVDLEDDERFLRADMTNDIFKLNKGNVLISSIGFGSIGRVQVFDEPRMYGTPSCIRRGPRLSLRRPHFLP